VTKILIADDELMLRAMAAEALEDAGFTVFQAADGREALTLLKRNPAIQLLITDVRMPEMDGWTLAETALKFRADLKVLLITGYDQSPEPGTHSFRTFPILRKPFNLQTLCDRAREIGGEPSHAVPMPAICEGSNLAS
jgi:CheY-like chemotaxis protein